MRRSAQKPGGNKTEKNSQFDENYRYILANLELNPAIQQGSQTILITSSSPGEGKSFTSSNLGAALAVTNKRVLLIDANLRNPRLHTELELSTESGLLNILEDNADLHSVLLSTTISNLYLLPAGTPSPNGSNLLSTSTFSSVLIQSKEMFDVVLIDSPAVLTASDALVIARAVDGVILVVDSKKTNRLIAQRALSALRRANDNIIGGVLNRIPKNQKNSYHFVEASF